MLEILYEDNHIIVVVKPQNVPTQGDESGDKDMLTMVKEYIKEKYNKVGEAFVGLIHRLDRPTGGILVFGKTSKACSRLCEQIRNDEVSKKYLAVLKGKPKENIATLKHYLKKNPSQNMVRVCPETVDGAKYAELSYEVLDQVDGLSLAKINLVTGRSHQIRVQMQTIGCPVFGDTKYGGEDMPKCKLNLWAYNLQFIHPTTKEKMNFTVYPPEDEMAWKKFINIEKYL